MRKKKKLTWICATAAIVSSCLFFTGCPAIYPDLSEIAPTSYGDWDGNYIYHGNVRSKTTGEDGEYLVQSVEKDGMVYRVAETTDHMYVGEEVWLCLTLENTGETTQVAQAETENEENAAGSAEDKTTCLMRYNLRTREASAVYFGTDLPASYIYKIGETSIVLSHWTGTREVYFRIDYNGNILNENAWEYAESYVYYGENGEYVLAQENGIYSYARWDTGEYTAFYQAEAEAEADAVILPYYLKQGEKEGFLLHEIYTYRKEEGHITSTGEQLIRREDGLLFYDIATGETTRLLDKAEKKVCEVQGEYVVLAEEEIFESRWFESLAPFSCETQHNAELLHTDCALYQIELSGADGAGLKELEAFDGERADEEFTNFVVLWNDTIAFLTYGIERGSGCYNGGPYESYYFYDPETGELTETDRDTLYVKIDLSYNATACDEYLYYEECMEYDGGGEAYTLYRYDTQTGETEAIQFWLSDLASMEYYENIEPTESENASERITFRFSEKMWFDESGYLSYSLGEFIVLDY